MIVIWGILHLTSVCLMKHWKRRSKWEYSCKEGKGTDKEVIR